MKLEDACGYLGGGSAFNLALLSVRRAGDAPDTLVPADGDTPAKTPGTAPSTVADR